MCIYIGDLHVWDIENNRPLYKEQNADNKATKSTKSIINIIFNVTRMTMAICYVDNTITLQSFGDKHFERTVC